MRKEQLPKGFGQRPSAYSHLVLPDGVTGTLQVIVDRTYGHRSVCPLTVKALAAIRHRDRHTISLHVAFLEDLGIVRLEKVKRGDGRSSRIVLCFREFGPDLTEASAKALEALPDKALNKRTIGEFKEERRAANKQAYRSRGRRSKRVKQSREMHVA